MTAGAINTLCYSCVGRVCHEVTGEKTKTIKS